jgi:carbonic anhydrase
MCELCPDRLRRSAVPSRRRVLQFAAAGIGLSMAQAVQAQAKDKDKPKDKGKDTKDAKDAKAPPKPQNAVSPDAALARLLEGNGRYVDGTMRRHDFSHEREVLISGQNPYAAILSCADSRIAPEYAFDSGRGDLFVCRVAGNFAADETVASLEYAVSVLSTPLILVLGHDACGAVDATIKSLKDDKKLPGHLPSLVEALAPSVKAVMQQSGDTLANAIRQNVLDAVAKVRSATPILSDAVAKDKLRVVGGIYRLKDGRVDLVA